MLLIFRKIDLTLLQDVRLHVLLKFACWLLDKPLIYWIVHFCTDLLTYHSAVV